MATRCSVRGECFVLHYGPVRTEIGARLGLIVPKRLVRAAVLRNAIKRQGREAFRLMAIDIPPCDLVLRLTRPVKVLKGEDRTQRKAWRREIEVLLKRLPSRSQ